MKKSKREKQLTDCVEFPYQFGKLPFVEALSDGARPSNEVAANSWNREASAGLRVAFGLAPATSSAGWNCLRNP